MYLFLYDNIDIIYFQTLVACSIIVGTAVQNLYKVRTNCITHSVVLLLYIIMFMFIYLFLFFCFCLKVYIFYIVCGISNHFLSVIILSLIFVLLILLLSSFLTPPRPSSPFTNTETIHIAKSLSQSNLKSWTCFSSAFNLSSHTSS